MPYRYVRSTEKRGILRLDRSTVGGSDDIVTELLPIATHDPTDSGVYDDKDSLLPLQLVLSQPQRATSNLDMAIS